MSYIYILVSWQHISGRARTWSVLWWFTGNIYIYIHTHIKRLVVVVVQCIVHLYIHPSIQTHIYICARVVIRAHVSLLNTSGETHALKMRTKAVSRIYIHEPLGSLLLRRCHHPNLARRFRASPSCPPLPRLYMNIYVYMCLFSYVITWLHVYSYVCI